MKKRIVIIVTIVSMLFPLCGYAQRRTEQNVAVGVKGGMTMSRVNFAPSIQQGMLKGLALECRQDISRRLILDLSVSFL